MLYATELSPEDTEKAQVAIASMWWEGNPCNMHLLDLAAATAEGVRTSCLSGHRDAQGDLRKPANKLWPEAARKRPSFVENIPLRWPTRRVS